MLAAAVAAPATGAITAATTVGAGGPSGDLRLDRNHPTGSSVEQYCVGTSGYARLTGRMKQAHGIQNENHPKHQEKYQNNQQVSMPLFVWENTRTAPSNLLADPQKKGGPVHMEPGFHEPRYQSHRPGLAGP